jgi:hypothetical protein
MQSKKPDQTSKFAIGKSNLPPSSAVSQKN